MDTTFIYALNDPETGECRYVGKSDCPTDRLSQHLRSHEKCHRNSWIKSLSKRGLQPLVEVLDEVPKAEWQFWERVWIKTSREIGMDLTNSTDGGDGLYNPSPEVRKKISVSTTGEKHHFFGGKLSPERIEKLVAFNTGKKRSPEILKKWRARKGEKRSPKACASYRIKKSGASSKFYGLCWRPELKQWRVRLSVFGKRVNLGHFSDEIEAAKAYDVAAKKYHGEFAKLNFPG